jgi:phage tail assembly protein T
MLSEMSASEFSDWTAFFSKTPFSDQLLDAEFATAKELMVAMFTGKNDLSAIDFSLLSQPEDEPEKTDEELMLAGEGLFGGSRYVPAN